MWHPEHLIKPGNWRGMSLNWNDCFLLNCYSKWRKNEQERLHISTSRTSTQRGTVGSHWRCLCLLSLPFLPCQISSQAYFLCSMERGSSLLGDCLLQEKQPLHRAEQREHQSKLMGPGGLLSAAKPTLPSVQQLQERAGNPGDALPWHPPRFSAGCSALLGVNERNSGFRCYSASFQNPAVWQEGRCFSRGNSNLFSTIQPAAEDSSCRAGGSITVTALPTIALQQ